MWRHEHVSLIDRKWGNVAKSGILLGQKQERKIEKAQERPRKTEPNLAVSAVGLG